MKRIRNLVCVALTAFTTLTLAAQQITGNIRGTIVDPSGAVVEAATVTARHLETGLMRTTVTDRSGNYVLVELPVGHYRLEVTAKGFEKYLQEGITLDLNQAATLVAHLRVGSESQQVEVNANALLIQN